MDHATLVILEIAIATTFAGMLAGYLVYIIKRPRSYFRVWTPDGGELSYRLKKLGSVFKWTDPSDKKQVHFPLDLEFARRAKNGGLRFIGDPKTGVLMKWNPDLKVYEDQPDGTTAGPGFVTKGKLLAWDQNPNAWEYMDPKYGPTALNDGRVLQIAKAMKGPAPWEQYILPGLIVIGIVAMATLFFVYKMYSNAHAGA